MTLRRAKITLGVRSEKIGIEGWQWSLQTQDDHQPHNEDAPVPNDEHVEHVDHVQNDHAGGSEYSPYIKEDVQDVQDAQGDHPGEGDLDQDHLPEVNEIPVSFDLRAGESATVAELKARRNHQDEFVEGEL